LTQTQFARALIVQVAKVKEKQSLDCQHWKELAANLQLTHHVQEDKVIVFERGELIFVINLHPCRRLN
jgi:hypothetical protein